MTYRPAILTRDTADLARGADVHVIADHGDTLLVGHDNGTVAEVTADALDRSPAPEITAAAFDPPQRRRGLDLEL